LISVIVLSAFYSSLLVCYFAIVAVNTNSYVYSYLNKRDVSITKVFIWSIASLNLVSLIIFSLLGFAIETLSNIDNFLIIYAVIAISPFGIFYIFSIIAKIKTGKHYWINLILYTIFTVILLPLFINA
jgi:hypothetical protein|tara:strand:- start:468 stop:851 length:384 start_codon:yes stop_codon:yes gene_type:complete